MLIKDYFNNLRNPSGQKPNVSFEFFPPKTEEMKDDLWDSITKLSEIKSSFVSITYGAGGSTRDRTFEVIKDIILKTNLKPAAHLTCVNSDSGEIAEILQEYWKIGVRHIVALRGDKNESNAKEGDYKYASDLVYAIKKMHNFEVSVAGYPEKHPESKSFEDDILNLKKKVDAGADRIITQYFFDNENFIDFVEKCRQNKISIPIIPGILPVTNFKRVSEFSKNCGASIPEWMSSIYQNSQSDQNITKLISAITAAEQVMDLYNKGVRDFHFYTLNRSELIRAICSILLLT